jgi:hypothetical protein
MPIADSASTFHGRVRMTVAIKIEFFLDTVVP